MTRSQQRVPLSGNSRHRPLGDPDLRGAGHWGLWERLSPDTREGQSARAGRGVFGLIWEGGHWPAGAGQAAECAGGRRVFCTVAGLHSQEQSINRMCLGTESNNTLRWHPGWALAVPTPGGWAVSWDLRAGFLLGWAGIHKLGAPRKRRH